MVLVEAGQEVPLNEIKREKIELVNRLKLRFNKEKDSKDRPASIAKPMAGDKTASYIELEKSE